MGYMEDKSECFIGENQSRLGFHVRASLTTSGIVAVHQQSTTIFDRTCDDARRVLWHANVLVPLDSYRVFGSLPSGFGGYQDNHFALRGGTIPENNTTLGAFGSHIFRLNQISDHNFRARPGEGSVFFG
jgi:hypothetical protein